MVVTMTYQNLVDSTSSPDQHLGDGFILPEATRSGYTLVGWSSSNTSNTPEAGYPGEVYKFSSNTTLYAVWLSGTITMDTDKSHSREAVSKSIEIYNALDEYYYPTEIRQFHSDISGYGQPLHINELTKNCNLLLEGSSTRGNYGDTWSQGSLDSNVPQFEIANLRDVSCNRYYTPFWSGHFGSYYKQSHLYCITSEMGESWQDIKILGIINIVVVIGRGYKSMVHIIVCQIQPQLGQINKVLCRLTRLI